MLSSESFHKTIAPMCHADVRSRLTAASSGPAKPDTPEYSIELRLRDVNATSGSRNADGIFCAGARTRTVSSAAGAMAGCILESRVGRPLIAAELRVFASAR